MYELVDRSEGGVAVSDHIYTEVGPGGKHNLAGSDSIYTEVGTGGGEGNDKFELMKNEAYDLSHFN